MADKLKGNVVVAGAFGTLWIDDQKVMEMKAVTATVEANRTDVQLGLSVDSKITGLKGSGTFTLMKVYTRGKKILEAWNKGEDLRTRIVTKIEDPNTPGKQIERVSIDNVWFNTVDLVKITKGEAIEEEFPFGFTPEDSKYEEYIK